MERAVTFRAAAATRTALDRVRGAVTINSTTWNLVKFEGDFAQQIKQKIDAAEPRYCHNVIRKYGELLDDEITASGWERIHGLMINFMLEAQEPEPEPEPDEGDDESAGVGLRSA